MGEVYYSPKRRDKVGTWLDQAGAQRRDLTDTAHQDFSHLYTSRTSHPWNPKFTIQSMNGHFDACCVTSLYYLTLIFFKCMFVPLSPRRKFNFLVGWASATLFHHNPVALDTVLATQQLGSNPTILQAHYPWLKNEPVFTVSRSLPLQATTSMAFVSMETET